MTSIEFLLKETSPTSLPVPGLKESQSHPVCTMKWKEMISILLSRCKIKFQTQFSIRQIQLVLFAFLTSRRI